MQPSLVYLLNNNGSGDGSGDGYGSGYGYGDGSGYGDGYGYGDGSGSGYGYGSYLIKIWGEWFEVSGKIENSLCKNIPPHHYKKVTREFLKSVDNLESLRAIREKIGMRRYIALFDLKLIDEDTDDQGHTMKLYKYDEKGEKVILLEVICPSTERIYHLYPPNQKSKNVWEAKASTFGEETFKPKIET